MKIVKDTPLAPFTSLHVGGNSQTVIQLENGDSLQEILLETKPQAPLWVLGYGTNCLISDKGLDGTVIFNQGGAVEQLTKTRLRVHSGALWDDVVRYAIDHQLWGLEFSSCIPGGVGAAVVGNIAAYGHKVADSLVEATILDSRSGKITTWSNKDFGFDYRSSVLQSEANKGLVVLEAIFELSLQPTGELEYESALAVAEDMNLRPDTLANRRQIILETRKRAGSLLINPAEGPWTAGSFFKNPLVDETQVQAIMDHEEKSLGKEQLLRQNQVHGLNKARVSAAHVLLAAGFQRGQSWGRVRLHPDHILKIENSGGATAQEIYDVVQEIVRTVKEKLDITLEPEVRILGAF